MILALVMLGFGYYIRVKPPSIRINRILYILLFGVFFGGIIWMLMYASRIVTWIINILGPTEYAGIALSLVVSFGIGAILGDLLGKFRNYKVSAQYSP